MSYLIFYSIIRLSSSFYITTSQNHCLYIFSSIKNIRILSVKINTTFQVSRDPYSSYSTRLPFFKFTKIPFQGIIQKPLFRKARDFKRSNIFFLKAYYQLKRIRVYLLGHFIGGNFISLYIYPLKQLFESSVLQFLLHLNHILQLYVLQD